MASAANVVADVGYDQHTCPVDELCPFRSAIVAATIASTTTKAAMNMVDGKIQLDGVKWTDLSSSTLRLDCCQSKSGQEIGTVLKAASNDESTCWLAWVDSAFLPEQVSLQIAGA